jgi:hypothetical protein
MFVFHPIFDENQTVARNVLHSVDEGHFCEQRVEFWSS